MVFWVDWQLWVKLSVVCLHNLNQRTRPLTAKSTGAGHADCMRNLTCNTPDTQLTASAGPSTRVLLWCLSLQPVDNPQVRCRRGTRERGRGRAVSNAAQRRHPIRCSGVGEWDRNRRNLGFEFQHTSPQSLPAHNPSWKPTGQSSAETTIQSIGKPQVRIGIRVYSDKPETCGSS